MAYPDVRFGPLPPGSIIASKVYGASADEALDTGGTDVDGGGWIVGVTLSGTANANNFVRVFDGDDTSSTLIFEQVSPATAGGDQGGEFLPMEQWRGFGPAGSDNHAAHVETGSTVTTCRIWYVLSAG